MTRKRHNRPLAACGGMCYLPAAIVAGAPGSNPAPAYLLTEIHS